MLVESGDANAGLSLTLGNADGIGGSNDLRLRVRGATGESIDLTVPINRFADPTKDFINATAVFNDSNDSRYVELYVNGALAGKTLGQLAASIACSGIASPRCRAGQHGRRRPRRQCRHGRPSFLRRIARRDRGPTNFYNYAINARSSPYRIQLGAQ